MEKSIRVANGKGSLNSCTYNQALGITSRLSLAWGKMNLDTRGNIHDSGFVKFLYRHEYSFE